MNDWNHNIEKYFDNFRDLKVIHMALLSPETYVRCPGSVLDSSCYQGAILYSIRL